MEDEKSTTKASRPYYDSDTYRMVPPDGGFGWIIVAASFVLHLLATTVPVAFGVIYVHLVRQEGLSNAMVSVLPALLICTSNFLAPITTALSRFYSYRRLSVIGLIFMVIGLGLCSISLNIFWLYFSYGIIEGIGHSLLTPMIFLIGQQYFHIRRVTSHGLATLGLTVGIVLIPSILIKLMQEYSLRGTFLIWSGLLLNGLLAVMFFHPVEWHLSPQIISKTETLLLPSVVVDSREEEKTKNEGDITIPNDAESTLNHRNKERDMLFQSLDYLPQEPVTGYDRPLSFISIKSIDSFKTVRSVFASVASLSLDQGMHSCVDLRDNGRNSHLLHRSETELKQPGTDAGTQSITDNSANNIGNSNYNICGLKFPKVGDIINTKLLKNPTFLICCFSSICNRQLIYSFTTYAPSMINESLDFERLPIYFFLLSSFEFLSKVLMALISDYGWVPRRYFQVVASIINCSAVLLVANSTSFGMIAFGFALFGFGFGIATSIGPVLLVEHMGTALLPYTYGLTLFIGAIFSVFAYLLQGWSIDATQSTMVLSYIIAVLAIIPGFLWIFASIFVLKKSS